VSSGRVKSFVPLSCGFEVSSSAGSQNLQILFFKTTVTEDFWQTAALQHTSFGSTEYRIIACFIPGRALYRPRIHITTEYHMTTEYTVIVCFIPRCQVLYRLQIHITIKYHTTTEYRLLACFILRYQNLYRLRIHITTEHHITTQWVVQIHCVFLLLVIWSFIDVQIQIISFESRFQKRPISLGARGVEKNLVQALAKRDLFFSKQQRDPLLSKAGFRKDQFLSKHWKGKKTVPLEALGGQNLFLSKHWQNETYFSCSNSETHFSPKRINQPANHCQPSS